MTPDPLLKKYPSNSSYSYAFNNPIFFLDQEGKSGVSYVYIMNGETKAEVHATVYIYSDDPKVQNLDQVSTQLKTYLNTFYNSTDQGTKPQIKVVRPRTDVDGNVVYKDSNGKLAGQQESADVNFVIDVQVVSLDVAKEKASKHNPENNYYLMVSDLSRQHNEGGNSGVLSANSPFIIWAHEFGHNLGWVPSNGDYKGQYGYHEDEFGATSVNSQSYMQSGKEILNLNSPTQYDLYQLNGAKPGVNKQEFGRPGQDNIYSSKDPNTPISTGN